MMPELPEVEVICRGLRPHIVGRTITNIWHNGKKLRWPVPVEAMHREMTNHVIAGVKRRAKYLQISLDTGAILIVHLGMTGNLGIFPPSAKHARHDHVLWSLDNGAELRYNDSRRFGSIQILSQKEAADREETIFKTTGLEPFSEDFSAQYLHKTAQKKGVTVKVFIMNSQIVAGIGNIYANESLWAAGIRPTRKASNITLKEWKNLATEVRRVLNHAIECGGSTISDFLNASQEKGYFQMNFKVYGKDGHNCTRCPSSIIKKLAIGGRASYYCPNCQR
jgi:formamidopyrimidine-DNA glycosylase